MYDLGIARLDIVVVVMLGMAICGMGGIGRVAAIGQWSHPLSIIGYILGALILVIAAAALLGWSLPLIHSDQQALVAIAVLAAAKMLISIWHSMRAPNPGSVQTRPTLDV